MRLLLPLVCGLAAGLTLSSVSWAEDTAFIINSITVQAKAEAARTAQPEAAPLAATGEAAAVLKAAAVPEAAGVLVPGPDRTKAETLRGSVLMLLLPNLCCR